MRQAPARVDLNRIAALGTGKGGRPRSIERAEVVAAAIAVLREDGLAALTMRRVAKDLGVGVSTVHNAVGSKEDLLQAIADSVLSEVPAQALDLTEPAESLAGYLLEIHHLLLRHPSVVQLSVIAPMRNPSVFRMQEQIVRALAAHGLDSPQVVDAYNTITNWFFGFTLSRIAGDADDRRDLVAGLDPAEYPALTGLLPHLTGPSSDDRFRAGLHRILHSYR